MSVLVTGAIGFVGTALCELLRKNGTVVCGAIRTLNSHPDSVELIAIVSLSKDTDWTKALRDLEHIVHLAARVHVT